MMKLCKTFFLISMLWCTVALAQNDSINRLEKVSVLGIVSKTKMLGLIEKKVTEKEKKRNPNTLTDVLRYNSVLMFRDYGNGGLSTATFRGTSATNTQVLWNGISINTVSNGQTDFNSIAAFSADEITVISGSNSVENGSGGIGGVVRLDNTLDYTKKNTGEFFSSYGSFNTWTNYLKYGTQLKKVSLKLGVTQNYSDNDYDYLETGYTDENGNTFKNINGVYKNLGINLSLGSKISKYSELLFHTNYYQGNRDFSAGLPNPSSGSETFFDETFRNLLEFKSNYKGYKNSIKLAYLTQDFEYISDKTINGFDYGVSDNIQIIYGLQKRYSKYFNLNASLGYDYITAESSGIFQKERVNTFQTLHIISNPISGLRASFSLRNENSSFVDIPLVYGVGATYKIFSYFLLKGNYATNYRQPSVNELFWPLSGNLELLPETSKQYDIGLSFESKYIEITTSYFNIIWKNKILWLPRGSTNAWRPINVNDVKNTGLEMKINSRFNIKKLKFDISGSGNFVKSININTENRIPFVSEQTYNYTVFMSYLKASIYYQELSQSKIYTTQDQLDFYSLDILNIKNIGFDYEVFKTRTKKLIIGVKVNNLFNDIYYFTNLRPMPGRNYSMNINYKF